MAAFGDYPYAPPFPPDNFGLRLGAPLTVVLSAADLFTSPVSIPADGTLVSSLVDTHDFTLVAFGFIAADTISASIQPFLDLAGTIPAGDPTKITTETNAMTQLPVSPLFRSVQVTLSNSNNAAVQVLNAEMVVRAVSI